MAIKNAAALLDQFCAAGVAVEVTHRSKQRLFGLVGLALLRGVRHGSAYGREQGVELASRLRP